MRKSEEQHLSYFRLLSLVFYHPSASLQVLAATMAVSEPTVRKMLAYLRERRVLSGRGPTLKADLQYLRRGLELGSSSAFVYIRLDMPVLRMFSSTSHSTQRVPYSNEEGLLTHIKDVLPTDDGKVIVERWFIQMGDPSAACVLLVHGAHEKYIHDFVRSHVEPCPGVFETKTLSITDME